MVKIKFIPYNREIEVPKGENLLEAVRKAGIFMDTPCNGSGACGKCKVKKINGNIVSKNSRYITEEEEKDGYILACQSIIEADSTVEVPETESSSMHGMKIEDFSGNREKDIFQSSKKRMLESGMKFGTYVEKEYLEMDPPTLDDNISDFERLKRHIRKQLNYSSVFCRLPILRKIPKLLRKANFKITITHIPRGNEKTTIINVEEGDKTRELYGAAVDIGTTSVAACLVNLYNGELMARASSGNAQIKYGADVINRIIYSTKGSGLQELNYAVIQETINPLLDKMYRDSGISRDQVVSFVAAGNTTMSHLFLGVYPNFLRMEPYIPAFVKTPFIKASELDIEVNPETFIYLVPCVASYVGGDISSGVLSSGMWNSEENVLFIDLGTNGEIVFGNSEYLMTCACSAGPAFEGGEISCGMRASGGAVEKVSIDGNYEPTLGVIGNEKPLGICGSGIIDLICEMMFAGIIDRKGKIVKGLDTNRIRFDEHGIGEYILAFKDQYNLERDIGITEVDIDSFIRAKAAIYSGITTLLNNLSMDFTDIDRIYIAGGIGNSLNIDNAVKIGMLPDIDQSKIHYIGNSSLMGCYLTLMSEDARHKLEQIANSMTYVELSVEPKYMDEFVSACFLPHTDIDKFPTVKKCFNKSV
ncbi:corrinoid activation/regeneration protein AcsV [uncultured Clostridium sp.]|uniref:corrinoid activation/regeneration protein AcsV n=1 Tax=uncultured Clostridium sp. TaxID=59620 RepID=UPI0025E2807F|nr:corrinoid activation/regeneration protein AcsV [uncultured Clostridium sp.]